MHIRLKHVVGINYNLLCVAESVRRDVFKTIFQCQDTISLLSDEKELAYNVFIAVSLDATLYKRKKLR